MATSAKLYREENTRPDLPGRWIWGFTWKEEGKDVFRLVGTRRAALAALRAFLASLLLLLSGSTLYAADTTATPKPRSKPSAQITVKVYPDKFQGKKERLILRPASTPGHCTAWIAADEDALWISALDSCRALLRKDGAR
jgi:hypothetical protein